MEAAEFKVSSNQFSRSFPCAQKHLTPDFLHLRVSRSRVYVELRIVGGISTSSSHVLPCSVSSVRFYARFLIASTNCNFDTYHGLSRVTSPLMRKHDQSAFSTGARRNGTGLNLQDGGVGMYVLQSVVKRLQPRILG